MGVYLGNRDDVINNYKKSEQKQKKYLKYFKKQNKMLLRISQKYGSRREPKKTNKIKAKASKKRSYSIISSSRSDLYSDSSLSSDSD